MLACWLVILKQIVLHNMDKLVVQFTCYTSEAHLVSRQLSATGCPVITTVGLGKKEASEDGEAKQLLSPITCVIYL